MIHGCAEIILEETPSAIVDITPVDGGDVILNPVNPDCGIEITDIADCECTIEDKEPEAVISMEPTEDAVITLEWVCGIGFSERYLCGSDSELITIDGNYLIVKYRPES